MLRKKVDRTDTERETEREGAGVCVCVCVRNKIIKAVEILKGIDF